MIEQALPLGCLWTASRLCVLEHSSAAWSVHCCRFVLQPGALPDGARLGTHLGRLRGRAAALEAAGAAGAGADLADVRVRVQERGFRCALPIACSRATSGQWLAVRGCA